MEIVYGFDVLMLILTCTAMTLQGYLFFTVIVASPKSMSQYRYFLCLFVVWDCFYNVTIGIIVMPEMCPPAPAALVHGLGQDLAQVFGFDVYRVLFGMIYWGGADILQLQLFCLLYRFCAIYPDPRLLELFMSWPSMIGFHIFGYCITIGVATLGYLCVAGEEKTRELMATFPDATFPHLNERTGIIMINTDSSWMTRTSIIIACLFVLCTAAGVGFSVYIIKYLKQHASSFTEKTYKLHLQLVTILVIQQITPFIFVILPLMTAYGMMLTGNLQTLSVELYNVGITMLTIYPSTNCLICIYFCSPYWIFTKKWINHVLYKLHLAKKPETPIVNIVASSTMSMI